jgi:excisionase family DNA binding protein
MNVQRKRRKVKGQKNDSLLTVKEVAKRVSIHVRTVYLWVDLGILPKPVKIGRSVRFFESSINEFIEGLKKGGKCYGV